MPRASRAGLNPCLRIMTVPSQGQSQTDEMAGRMKEVHLGQKDVIRTQKAAQDDVHDLLISLIIVYDHSFGIAGHT